MSRPEGIPQDVWEAAQAGYFAHVDEHGADIFEDPTEQELLEVCARAILAERERCAKMAEALHGTATARAIRGERI